MLTTDKIKSSLIKNVLDAKGNGKDKDTEGLLATIRKDSLSQPVVYVGAGTCGLGAGAGKTLKMVKEYLDKKNIEANVISVGCIGLCSSEPIMDVKIPGKNRLSLQNVTADKVEGILDNVMKNEVPSGDILGQFEEDNATPWKDVEYLHDHPFFKDQKRMVLDNCGVTDPLSIEEYIARGGYKPFIDTLRNKSREEVCEIIEKAGLKGRGGGGFPTGLKCKFTLQAKGVKKYLVCNADEGDPGAFMDRAVIEGDPHKLVEGMAITAYAIGASVAYVYIRAEYPLAIERLEKALDRAKAYGLIGKNVFDTGFDIEFKIKKGAGAFVCGEETALMHSIEGKRGMPRPRPPYPSVSGLFGKPTSINNVETLSNIPGIMKKGAEWFASVGTENSKGTKVFALSGKINRTGLIEIPMGTTVREIIFNIGGGIINKKAFKAVQMGGPSGGCVTEQNLDIQIDYQSLLSVGAMMGSGGMVVMDEGTCMVDVAKFFMDFIQRESCGKCIPCREGTKRMLEILQTITSKPGDNDLQALHRFKGVMQLEKIAHVIKDTSLCGLGQSAPNPVLSTLRWFKDEYEEHVFERKCRAGACQELKIYTIDPEKCTGCTACARKCPTDAITGSRKEPHVIDQDKCIGCGNCYEVCKFDAVGIE